MLLVQVACYFPSRADLFGRKGTLQFSIMRVGKIGSCYLRLIVCCLMFQVSFLIIQMIEEQFKSLGKLLQTTCSSSTQMVLLLATQVKFAMEASSETFMVIEQVVFLDRASLQHLFTRSCSLWRMVLSLLGLRAFQPCCARVIQKFLMRW